MITYQPSLLRRVAHLHSSNFKHTHTHNATAEQLALEDMLSAQSKRLITEKDVPRELRFSLLGEKRDVFVGLTRTLYACLVRIVFSRVDQNPKCTVCIYVRCIYMVFLAGKSPNIKSCAVNITILANCSHLLCNIAVLKFTA